MTHTENLECRIAAALEQDGLSLSPAMWDRFERHAALIREWNSFVSLVSVSDARDRLPEHLADALSLAPWARLAQKNGMLDIGSGGGYPAIPLKILLPDLPITLVERNSKKVGFLRKVIGALGLTQIKIIAGEFPGAVRGLKPGVVTARAVERPQHLLKAMISWLPQGTLFLCQSGAPLEGFPGVFHVEHVEDVWCDLGLRRGDLHVLSRRAE